MNWYSYLLSCRKIYLYKHWNMMKYLWSLCFDIVFNKHIDPVVADSTILSEGHGKEAICWNGPGSSNCLPAHLHHQDRRGLFLYICLGIHAGCFTGNYLQTSFMCFPLVLLRFYDILCVCIYNFQLEDTHNLNYEWWRLYYHMRVILS